MSGGPAHQLTARCRRSLNLDGHPHGFDTGTRGHAAPLHGVVGVVDLLRRRTLPAAEALRQPTVPSGKSAFGIGATARTLQVPTAQNAMCSRHLPKRKQEVRAALHHPAPLRCRHGLLQQHGRALPAQERPSRGAGLPRPRVGHQWRTAHQSGNARLREPHGVRVSPQVRPHPMTPPRET